MTKGDDRSATPTDTYSCESIVVLDRVEAVRKRPGMYIGDTHDGSGLHNLARELVDNALAQHWEGHCHRLAVTIHVGGALTVEDDGPGIPADVVCPSKPGLTVLEAVLEGGGRDARRSLCGVGLSVVSALCERLVVEVRHGGRAFRVEHHRGRPVAPLACLGAPEGTGTRITLHPDPLIFDSTASVARAVHRIIGSAMGEELSKHESLLDVLAALVMRGGEQA